MAALLRSSILISLALAISAIQPDNVNWSPLQQNGTQQVDQVVNQILESSREARNIDGYNDVYSDPNIQQALQQGNDQEARNLIKDKLCNLGLMQCENNQIAPKRPPGNIIYAQPQRPPPYRGGGGGGGFPQSKPPFNTHKSEYISSPPYPFIDSSGPPASFNGPIYHSKPPGPIYEGSKPPGPIYEGPIPPGPIYEPSSSGGGGGIHYDSNFKKYQHSQKFEVSESAEKPTIIVNAQGGTPIGNQPLTGGVNTLNIHHHFHHLDDGHSKTPGPVHTNGLNTGAGAFTSLDNSFTYGGNKNFKSEFSSGASFGSINGISGNNGVYGTSGNGGINGGLTTNSLYSNGFSENAVYGGGVKPVIEEAQLLNYGNQGNSEYFNEFNGNSHVPRKQQFGSSYGGGSGNGGLSTGGFSAQITNGIYSQPNNLYSNANKYAVTSGTDYYNTGESQLQNFGLSRQGQFDCVCVPYNRCPAQDVLGRRDDLLLPLDPRHLTTKIEAILDDDIGTSNNLTRIVKHVNDETINDKNITSITDNEHNNETSTKKISKRDVSETQKDNAEARFLGLGGSGHHGIGGGGGGIGDKKIVPTFGVSFGLPYPTGGYGYPINPYGGNPLQNPYFGSISPNGLNLGLINVNPLVSFQVSKNEYGDKLLKPLVNLHVTPNENLIHKVGSLFKQKKFGFNHPQQQGFYNQHYHTHTHYPAPPEIYHPHHHHPPPHHVDTSFNHPSYYPHSSFGQTGYDGYSEGGFSSGGGGGGGYGFYKDNSGYGNYDGDFSGPGNYNYDHFDRSSNTSAGIYTLNTLPYNYQDVYPENKQLQSNTQSNYAQDYSNYNTNPVQSNNNNGGINYNQVNNKQKQYDKQSVTFPNSRRRKRNVQTVNKIDDISVLEKRQISRQYNRYQQCPAQQVCCRTPVLQQQQQQQYENNRGQCGRRNAQGVTGRIKNPVYIDGDSEFGEYPWQAAILKKDAKESVYVCGGTLIDNLHILTAAHCVKTYSAHDLRIRLGEWDVNHDVEFFPYVERDAILLRIHPEYYAGTLDNDIAILRMNSPVNFATTPHISPACLPDKFSDFTGTRCWTTGWGKDAFGDFGKYQNILKEVDVPIINQLQCQEQLRHTRLGYTYKLNPGFICAGGEEGKDACKGDGGGPLVCDRGGIWHVVGIVSWGIGCGQVNVPGVYARVSYYLDWIQQITQTF